MGTVCRLDKVPLEKINGGKQCKEQCPETAHLLVWLFGYAKLFIGVGGKHQG